MKRMHWLAVVLALVALAFTAALVVAGPPTTLAPNRLGRAVIRPGSRSPQHDSHKDECPPGSDSNGWRHQGLLCHCSPLAMTACLHHRRAHPQVTVRPGSRSRREEARSTAKTEEL